MSMLGISMVRDDTDVIEDIVGNGIRKALVEVWS